jgi:small subunit ribosomal protein S5
MARERRDKGETDSRDNALVDYVVKIRRSACVVKGGRRFSFNALVVVGDRRGKVSYGYGKANEVPPAVEKAIKEGEGNVQRTRKISLRGDTIPHRVVGKYGASRVILVPAGPGTGVKAGPGVRAGVRRREHPHQGSRQHQPDQPGEGDHRWSVAVADEGRSGAPPRRCDLKGGHSTFLHWKSQATT